MPELPEVETMVREVAPRLIGRGLQRARLNATDVLRGVSRERLVRTLRGNRIAEVTRRAKHFVLLLESGQRLVIQPGMTGGLRVHDRPVPTPDRHYVVLDALLDDGAHFVYRDVRRLGTIRLLSPGGWSAYTERIGPEPLDPAFDAQALADRLQGTRQAIKKALMDQRRLAGVGNIYANEALFRAGIDPSRQADRLDRQAVERLHRMVYAVLSDAIAARGTTVRDYRTGTGERGGYQLVLEVYGRGGQPCRRCGSTLATTHAIDGRATTFCWRCQGA